MNWRYGPGPSGVNPSASHSRRRQRAQCVEPASGDRAELVEQLRAVEARVRRDPLLVGLADVVAHVRCVARHRRSRSSAARRRACARCRSCGRRCRTPSIPGTRSACPTARRSGRRTARRCRPTPLPGGDQRLGHARTVPAAPTVRPLDRPCPRDPSQRSRATIRRDAGRGEDDNMIRCAGRADQRDSPGARVADLLLRPDVPVRLPDLGLDPGGAAHGRARHHVALLLARGGQPRCGQARTRGNARGRSASGRCGSARSSAASSATTRSTAGTRPSATRSSTTA